MTRPTILQAVCAYYSITITQLCSKCRERELVEARHVAMYLLYRDGLTKRAAALLLGGRHHTTAMHGIEQASYRRETDPTFRRHLEEIERTLHAQALVQDDFCPACQAEITLAMHGEEDLQACPHCSAMLHLRQRRYIEVALA